MKVLLLQQVAKVGKKDEVVDVSDGYAAHSLFPKKLAVPATKAAVEARDRRHQNMQTEKEVRHRLLTLAIAELRSHDPVMQVKANPQGNLFSKIRPSDISAFLQKTYNIVLAESILVVPEIKKLGVYEVGVVDEGYTETFTLRLTQ